MINITSHDIEEKPKTVQIDHHPDECPDCHRGMEPVCLWQSFLNRNDKTLHIVYRCSRLICQNVFLANYRCPNNDLDSFFFESAVPQAGTRKNFEDTINEISPDFVKIYNEALAAEQGGLLEICGGGYRKALEFLIKDYIIKNNPDKKEEINNKFLGACINEYIADTEIKEVAKRAVWLGNDEIHYYKKWEDKDLNDLKTIIDITLYWIEKKKSTEDVLKSMSGEEESSNEEASEE